jgi:hypothetical protein
MVNLPNHAHSLRLNDLCDRINLTDPFRMLNPHTRPRSNLARNRSRIDFFLVNINVVNNDISCSIAPNLQNKLFDHRAILLSFIRPDFKSKTNKGVINNLILKHDVIDYVVFGACAEAYAIHAAERDLPVPLQREILRKIGDLKIF